MSIIHKLIERPYRTPKNVEHLMAEPGVARAGVKGRWTLSFVLSRAVPPGHHLFLQIHGKRSNLMAWNGLQAEDPTAEGYVSLETQSHGALKPIEALNGLFQFELPADGLPAGERVSVDVGGPAGVMPPVLATSSKFFLLLDVPPGEKPQIPVLLGEATQRVVGVCQIVLAGGDTDRIVAHAPSSAVVGEEIRILFRPEDRWRNVATSEPGRIVVRLDGREIETQVEPVEGSACRWISGIRLAEPATHRLEVEDMSTGLRTLTNPIICTAKPPDTRVLWGMIHGHTEMSDGFGTLDHYFRYMRDECRLDFGATGDHDHLYETSDEMWSEAQNAVARYNEPGKFTTFLGYEWAKWRRNGDGDRNVYYLDDTRPMYRSDEGHCPLSDDLFRALRDEDAIVIPHHTANPRSFCDWKGHDQAKERLVEIYSMWGNSERSKEDGNIYPLHAPTNDAPDVEEYAPGFVQKALELGWRVGFTAGGDDHRAHPGDNIKPEPDRYTAGLLAVHAKDNTREAIWDALYNRRCFATTGARITVDFHVDGHPMGSELRASDFPDIASRRGITISVHGTDTLAKIEIVRNNQDVHVVTPGRMDADIEWIDDAPLSDIYLPPALHSPTPFAFYYVRVTQADGEMAWGSPVWIVG